MARPSRLRKLAKRIVPESILECLRTWRGGQDLRRYDGMAPESVFTDIYREKSWNGRESASGPGSDLAQTVKVRRALPMLIEEYRVRSLLDVPCGDFNWMSQVVTKFPDISYIGIDIVPAIIEQNRALHTSDNVQFLHGDITTSAIPKADLIINRDCLMHCHMGT